MEVTALTWAIGVNGLLQRAGMWPPLLWTAAVSTRLYSLPMPEPASISAV